MQGFDPDRDLVRIGLANQTTMLRNETLSMGKMFEKAMMQKYGPAELKQHYMVMDTICDATQVSCFWLFLCCVASCFLACRMPRAPLARPHWTHALLWPCLRISSRVPQCGLWCAHLSAATEHCPWQACSDHLPCI